MDANEEIVESLRTLFATAAARLTHDIEPSFTYVWRDAAVDGAAEIEDDDQE